MRKIIIILGMGMLNFSVMADSRFIKGNGKSSPCVTDSKTNLMWVKIPPSSKYTWDEAVDVVKKLNYCGYQNWRLPTREEQYELQSDAGHYASFAWLNTHGFSEIKTDFYWSQDIYTGDTAQAWGFFMYSGKTYNEPKNQLNYIWPVRDNKEIRK